MTDLVPVCAASSAVPDEEHNRAALWRDRRAGLCPRVCAA